MELNKVLIIGNLTKDPDLRYTGGGTAVCDLRIASTRRFRRGGDGSELEDETCFVDIVVWGRSGENCNQYLRKGSPILIEGRLKFDEWKSQEGQKRSKHVIVADRVQFFPKKSSGGGEGESQSYGKSHHEDLPGESRGESPGASAPQEDFNSEVPF